VVGIVARLIILCTAPTFAAIVAFILFVDVILECMEEFCFFVRLYYFSILRTVDIVRVWRLTNHEINRIYKDLKCRF
jgi:hypothetical protein